MWVKDRHTLEELERLERTENDAHKAKRIRVVLLALKGYTAPAISQAVGLSRRICQRWVYRYNDEGLDGLDDRRGNVIASCLGPEDTEKFRQRIEKGPTPEDDVCALRGVDFRRILEKEFGVVRSLTTVYSLLHKLGYSCLKPRPKHPKSDHLAQETFRQELPEKLKSIAETHPDKKLCVYFEDEARFGQQGTITHVWAKKGSRPTAIRQTEYQYLWVLAAICPETGKSDGLISPCLNAEVINVFLDQFSKQIGADEHAVLIWDQAGFHTSLKLKIPGNVTIVKLPPYSPELNPVENLWHYLKSHDWSNNFYRNYEALEEKAMQSWRRVVMNDSLMKTVCAAPYAKRAISD
jgi:transposase